MRKGIKTLTDILVYVAAIRIVLGIILKVLTISIDPVSSANLLQLTYVCLGFAIFLAVTQICDKIMNNG